MPSGKKGGRYEGRVAVSGNGFFNISIETKTIQRISYRHCQMLHASDSYSYAKGSNNELRAKTVKSEFVSCES